MKGRSETFIAFGKSAVLFLTCLFSLTANAASNAIESVEYSQLQDQVLVKVLMKHTITTQPSTFTISSPPRVAFDFSDTENLTGQSNIQTNIGFLRNINVIQSDVRTRVLVNLISAAQVTSRIDGAAFYISIPQNPSGSSKSASSSEGSSALNDKTASGREPKDVTALSSSRAVWINTLDFRAESMDVASVKIDLSEPGALLDARQQSNGLSISFPNSVPLDRLIKKYDVRDFGTPIETIAVTKSGQNTLVTFTNRGDWDYNVRQMDTQVTIEVRRNVRDPNALVGTKDTQGKVVSFNFTQPVPVGQMIGIFQDITGLNFMVMPGVSGEIQSLKMENTPIDEAITVISRMYNLGFRKYGSVVVVGRADDLVKYDKDERERATALASAEPIQQETFKIKYRLASEISASLQKNASGPAAGGAAGGSQASASKERSLIGDRGMMTVDDATNTIYVEETKTQLSKIRERIQALDRPSKQVMIEARIVEASFTFFESLGVKISALASGTGPRYQMNDKSSNLNFSTSASAVNLPGSTGFLKFTLYDNKQTNIANLELSAAEGDSTVKQLANPKIMTRDTQKASLKFGTKIAAYSVATAGATPSVSYTDAVTMLDVKPQVQLDGKIQMQITVKNDSPSGTGGNINNREVTTNVIVENGGSIVIGGMYKQDETIAQDRVPFFGDLPYIGWLFKQKVTNKTQSEMLVFITPRVVSEELILQ